MVDIQKIEQALADQDGSLRDIHLAKLNREELTDFLKWYTENYQVIEAMNGEGDDIEDVLQSNDSPFFLRIIGKRKDGALITDLNAHISEDSENIYDVELDFLPNNYSYNDFIEFLKNILDSTKSRKYYVKHENVSWKYGDTSDDSGVIFSHEDIVI